MYNGGTSKKEIIRDISLDGNIFNKFKNIFSQLKDESNLSSKQIIQILDNEKQICIPVTVLSNRKLGILEVIVKFLHEDEDYTFSQIAGLLKRDNRTIWSSYSKAHKKAPEKLVAASSEVLVPLKVFSNRSLGVLECLVLYLKNEFGMKYSEIGRVLSRDQRTIWTVYNRAIKKQSELNSHASFLKG